MTSIADSLNFIAPETNWTAVLTGTLDDEWSAIKCVWMTRIRTCHPDKGGDAKEFLAVQRAFEALRLVYESKTVASFSKELSAACGQGGAAASDHVPSWDFYEVWRTHNRPATPSSASSLLSSRRCRALFLTRPAE